MQKAFSQLRMPAFWLGLLAVSLSQAGCAHPVMVQPSVVVQARIGAPVYPSYPVYGQVYRGAPVYAASPVVVPAPVYVQPRVLLPVPGWTGRHGHDGHGYGRAWGHRHGWGH